MVQNKRTAKKQRAQPTYGTGEDYLNDEFEALNSPILKYGDASRE